MVNIQQFHDKRPKVHIKTWKRGQISLCTDPSITGDPLGKKQMDNIISF